MTIIVYGTPAPQGSKRHVGRGIMIESSKKVAPWREAVKWEAMKALAGAPPIDGPVAVDIDFYLPRPKSAKRGAVPSKKPDLDKLVRSTMDALTDAGVWVDDSRVVHLRARKHYSPDTPFAFIDWRLAK